MSKHTFERMSSICYADHHHGNGAHYFVRINQPSADSPGVHKEFEYYQSLRHLFNFPAMRLGETSQGTVLVVKRAEGIPLSQAIKTHPKQARLSLESYYGDLEKSWEKTRRPMDSTECSKDLRTYNMGLLEVMPGDLPEIVDKELIVNGQNYPSVGNMCREVKGRLEAFDEPWMVFSHGDEHLDNIFSSPDGRYQMIDPFNTGYTSMAQVFNKHLGETALFNYDYQTTSQVNGKVEIETSLSPQSKQVRELIEPPLNELKQKIGSQVHINEYLFTLMLRGATLRIAPKWRDLAIERTMAYLAMATEYYAKSI